MKSTSPANIKLEPVQVMGSDTDRATASVFDCQRKPSADVMKACGSLRNSPIKEASRSPSKASTSKSPSPLGKSPQPAARMVHNYSVKSTDQSPEVAMPLQACTMGEEGTGIRSQSMYENLMRIAKEQEQGVP